MMLSPYRGDKGEGPSGGGAGDGRKGRRLCRGDRGRREMGLGLEGAGGAGKNLSGGGGEPRAVRVRLGRGGDEREL